MRRIFVVAFGVLMAASPLAAQDNPFAFTGGSVKSAYIVYDMTSTGANQGKISTFEIGVAPDRFIVRSVAPVDLAGKKVTIRGIMVTTKDSQYNYTVMGSERGDGQVSPTLRPHLAREYAALNAGGKARFRENVKLAMKASGSSSDNPEFITLTGDKTGSETIGGHKCDVYKEGSVTACVMPQAPMVMLRWTSKKDQASMVAKKITLNGPIPPTASLFPKGVAWKKNKAYDDADFITSVWALKKQTDPETVPPATVAKFAVTYLATPEATTEFRAMQPDASTSEEASEEEASEDGATDEDGN